MKGNIEKKFHFVFITTCLANNKQYVGDHSTNDLSDGYIGSGRPLYNNAKKKYGKKNFIRKDLEFFPTRLEAANAQRKYIAKYNTLSPYGYNICPDGGTFNGGKHSDESKAKIGLASKKRKRSVESRMKTSQTLKGHSFSLKTKEKISNSLKGKTLSVETKEKISKSVKRTLHFKKHPGHVRDVK